MSAEAEADFRYVCEFCGELKPGDQVGRCGTPEVEEPFQCYSCGEVADFSSSQAQKGSRARCAACVEGGRRERHQPFRWRAEHGERGLVEAVEEIDEELVFTLMERAERDGGLEGLVDQARQLRLRVPNSGMGIRAAYLPDGRPAADEALFQPTTPLKMAVFRLSDCMLDEADRQKLVRIAQALIERGASKDAARAFFESRYGPAEPGEEINAFTQLYALLRA